MVSKLLFDFVTKSSRPSKETVHICNLAAGNQDVVVVLERPYHNLTYDVTFEELVVTCPTLRAVDRMLRFATSNTRNVHNIIVLDASAFKAKKKAPQPTDRKCFDQLH